MHPSVCSSVSVGVARPPLEGPWGCCNLRRGHAVDCQTLNRAGFNKLNKKKEDQEFCRLARKSPFEKPRVKFSLKAAHESIYLAASASTSEEGTSVNGSVGRSENGWVEARARFDEAMPNGEGDEGKNLVHALHEAARVFQSAMEEQESLTRGPWFAQRWLGIDKNAWMKTLAYQASVHSLLQAVQEIAVRGEGRDRDAHIFVQRSLMRQSAPLKDSIRLQLASRDPSADDWLWLQQHPQAVASFVGFLEKDKRFTSVTSTGWEGVPTSPSKASDIALLTLSLSSSVAVMKLGSAAVSCPLFSALLPEEVSRQMQKLPEYMSMEQVCSVSSSVGLRREFLNSCGSRAADDKKWQENEREGAFWVDLVQQLLKAALIREGVRSKLNAFDSVEVLEKDLAMFGFFVALGRSTRAYLAGKGVGDSEESLASLLRYLDGGCVLFYPQLATVSTYQLFVEVVCEEMEWLPFYQWSAPVAAHEEHNKVKSGVGKAEKQMAIGTALQTCSLWVHSFVYHSMWVQHPQGFRSATFLQKSQQRLEECNKVYKKDTKDESFRLGDRGSEVDSKLESLIISDFQKRAMKEETSSSWVGDDTLWNWDGPNVETSKLTADCMGLLELERQLRLFDKELQNVELAMEKLELLVKESESSSVASGRERLAAAAADLEKIRLLKKEVEALEASLKAKAGLMEKSLSSQLVNEDAGKDLISGQKSSSLQDRDLIEELQSKNMQNRENPILQGAASLGQGLVRFLFPFSNLRKGREDVDSFEAFDEADDKGAELAVDEAATVMKEVGTFEQLRGELAALESRIRKSAGPTTAERPSAEGALAPSPSYDLTSSSSSSWLEDDDDVELAGAYGDVFSKSIEKLRGASADAWRGTRLLGTDVGAAMVLLRRSIAGQELTNREQKILRRTLTDLASVIPIGFLMLLPVTAVGHAAILAAIQKYVPALVIYLENFLFRYITFPSCVVRRDEGDGQRLCEKIPSAYGPKRLDVLRRLEQLKDLESDTTIAGKALPPPRKLKKSSSQTKSNES